MNDTKRKSLAVLVGLAALAGAVGAGAAAQGQDPTAPPADLPAAEPRGAADGDLGALSRARGADDVLPAEVASTLTGPQGPSGLELYPDRSRKGASGSGGRAVYLVPSNQGACAVHLAGIGAAGVSCNTADALAKGVVGPSYTYSGCEMSDGRSDCGDIALYGVAPDGVATVEVERADGTVAGGSVADNVYLVDAGTAEPRAIRFADGDGAAVGRVSLTP